jgi:AcrR family transcriptional regulator
MDIDAAEDGPKRRRRSRDQIEGLLRDNARLVFAEAGFDGATTREIALRSGVSETLLFRYFGGKEAIFDAVVSEPFRQLMQEFSQGMASDRFSHDGNDRFVADAFALALENRDVLKAYLLRAMTPNGEKAPSAAFDSYFAEARERLEAQHRRAGTAPGFDLDIAVRLGFTMILVAVLGGPQLFHGIDASAEKLRETLQAMMFRAFQPGET